MTHAQAEVIGTGILTSGNSFYLVSSQSEPSCAHVVEQRSTRLWCGCKGYAYRGRCKHMDAVAVYKQRLKIVRVDAEAKIAKGRVSRDMSAMPATPVTEVPAHLGDTAILRRSKRPFIICR